MLRVGQPEIDAVAEVIRSGKLFRYGEQTQCGRFEERYARFLGVNKVQMTASGTAALVVALGALGIGPGDEVIVPSHTYMATAIAVLGVGAIPIIVDIDESLTLSPAAFEDAIGPRTRAVIPVHMWGLPCDMDAILEIAKARKVFVVEDACQGVGGAYKGRMLGSMGDVGAFSFNYYKNMTCGEGGAVCINDPWLAQRVRCMTDSCSFFWTGKENDVQPFSVPGSRASEIEGAILNAQLDRLPGMITSLRRQKQAIIDATSDLPGLTPAPQHSPGFECGTHLFYQFATREQAETFAGKVEGTIVGRTGRHTFHEWEPILKHRAGHHAAMNPYQWPANRECRSDYPSDLCQASLDILFRTVQLTNALDRTPAQLDAQIARIRSAAEDTLPASPVAAAAAG